MMKKFLLVVCGSFVGVFLALMVFVFASFMLSMALVASGNGKATTETIKKNSVLRISLSGELIDREGQQELSMMQMVQGNLPETQSLTTLLAAIEKAADNDDISGIYLDCKGMFAAPASRQVLRRALSEFKQKSKKFVYAYGYEGFSQGDYYIASMADSIFLNPLGSIDIHGLGGATPFYKGLLDKVGVEMQAIRVGTFKSAVEPYILTDMSEANRMQTEHYLGAIWSNMVDTIAASRKTLSAQLVNQMADSLLVTMPADTLLARGMVDALRYSREMENTMKALLKVDEDDDINWVSPATLAPDVDAAASGKHIAVLYACGEIDGGSSAGIDTEELSKVVYDLADDDDVVALVMRVNSPGGSAFGSEQLWKALNDFKATKKPFVVSMGDYAASGGYYISAGADRIFAEPTTLTGSIGIFGLIPCAEDLVENKLGVHMAVVQTNANTSMGLTKRLTPSQRSAIQRMVNDGYELFTKRCAQGRHVSQDSIKAIAEGRVWEGATALKIGLVDGLGDLRDAINYAAEKAGIKRDDIKTQNYPEVSTDWRSMLRQAMNTHTQEQLKQNMGLMYHYYEVLQTVTRRDHLLCLMEPMEYTW